MSITVTPAEIEHYREILAQYADALIALDALADCDGDLEDATINLAIHAGMEPNTSDRWIDGLAKRWRHVLCQPEMKQTLDAGLTANLVLTLTEYTTLPLSLALPVAIYVLKTGVQEFCHLFETKIQ